MMKIYFLKLLLQLMPSFLRGISLKILFLPVSAELAKVKDSFDVFRSGNLYTMSVTPQVFSIEKLLNDRLDNDLRRIFLSDGVLRNVMYSFTNAEAKPIYLGATYLYSDLEFGYQDNISFYVNVHEDIVIIDAELAEIVNSYKLPGKKFKILRYA